MALFDAAVDLNPHQNEASLFALQSPLRKASFWPMRLASGRRSRCEELKTISWDFVVIDEADKPRDAWPPEEPVRSGNLWATQDCRKLLVAATSLQNSFLEIYDLATSVSSVMPDWFRSEYAWASGDLEALRRRLAVFCSVPSVTR